MQPESPHTNLPWITEGVVAEMSHRKVAVCSMTIMTSGVEGKLLWTMMGVKEELCLGNESLRCRICR